MRKRILLLCFLIFPAQAVELQGGFTQGGYVLGQAPDAREVKLDGTSLPLAPDGTFFGGFDRQHAPEATLTLIMQDGNIETDTLLVTPQDYEVQHIKGVPSKTVNPDPEQVKRSQADSAAIRAARAHLVQHNPLAMPFIWPVEGRTSGVFGSRRTYNGEERSWHKGHDIAAPTGTPVVAPAAGTVRLARDTFFNGNLLIIDHGLQLFTIYAHLDSMAVKAGDSVTQGQKIGEVGTTGRSTGPHLHWGFYWKNVALDPILFMGKTR